MNYKVIINLPQTKLLLTAQLLEELDKEIIEH